MQRLLLRHWGHNSMLTEHFDSNPFIIQFATLPYLVLSLTAYEEFTFSLQACQLYLHFGHTFFETVSGLFL